MVKNKLEKIQEMVKEFYCAYSDYRYYTDNLVHEIFVEDKNRYKSEAAKYKKECKGIADKVRAEKPEESVIESLDLYFVLNF